MGFLVLLARFLDYKINNRVEFSYLTKFSFIITGVASLPEKFEENT